MRNYPAILAESGPDPRVVAVIVPDGVTAFELGVACDVFGD